MRSSVTVPVLVCGLAGSAACAEQARSQGFAAGERVVHEVTDTVFVVGGADQDTALFTPTMVAFMEEGIAVWDRDRAQILVFSREDGSSRWRYGAKGSGPGEFSGVTQIAVDDEDRLWVIDPENVRITVLDAEGGLVRAFPIPDIGFADRLAPLGDGRALLMGLDPMIHTIDDRGNLLASVAHPYRAYATLHPLSAYNRAVHDLDSDSTVFFFYYGGGFARTDEAMTQTATLSSYVEPIPFPDVIVDRTENANGSVTTSTSVNASRLAAKGGTAADGVLHLLFQGDSEYGHRLIDNYSIGSGDYTGSWLLPDTTRAIAVDDGLIATLVEEPYPALVVRRAPER